MNVHAWIKSSSLISYRIRIRLQNRFTTYRKRSDTFRSDLVCSNIFISTVGHVVNLEYQTNHIQHIIIVSQHEGDEKLVYAAEVLHRQLAQCTVSYTSVFFGPCTPVGFENTHSGHTVFSRMCTDGSVVTQAVYNRMAALLFIHSRRVTRSRSWIL